MLPGNFILPIINYISFPKILKILYFLKGYYALEIPTKKYIKAYIQYKFGEKPIINKGNHIGNKLYDLLKRQTAEFVFNFSSVQYNTSVTIFITNSAFYRRGGNLTEYDVKNFNLFIEEEIKRNYRMLMDILIDMRPSFEANLPEVRKRIGIDLEAWDTESIKKDYYRYRKRQGMPLLYKKDDNFIISIKKPF